MVHIMDWSALKFMRTILPFHEVAVNDQPEIERFKRSTRMSQTGRMSTNEGRPQPPRNNRPINQPATPRFASITVNAAIFTIRRTVALEVRIFTGALTPNRNGPTATLLPASVLSRL